MSSRRNGSVSRAAEAASKNRLHMDRNPQTSRITDPSNPAGRRKEIDNVMKRARQASPGSWDRKLLEVEEKDPNRWRHTGYKQLYLEPSGSVSPRRSRSPHFSRRMSRSPVLRRSRSPVPRRSRSPVPRRSRSPVPRRSRSPVPRRSRSPVPRKSPARRKSRSPKRTPRRAVRGSPVRRSPPPRRPRSPPPPRPRPARPPSPPHKRTPSESSGSSCSDESCSVCSAKNKKPPPPPPKGAKIPNSNVSKAVSPSRSRVQGSGRAVQPTRELLKAREGTKRSREEKVLEWQRTQTAVKVEGARPRDPRPRPPPAAVSAAALAAALADSDSDSSASAAAPPHRLTLSERFGKMAQWSADRSSRLENMRITRRESSLHVHIERDRALDVGYPGVEPEAPAGSYPESLAAAAPGGLPSWDDVTVRYDYYRQRGYLRGLTLGDYVKWEEWWYKYQEWLERERAYERWADGEPRPRGRERRRKGGRHRRS